MRAVQYTYIKYSTTYSTMTAVNKIARNSCPHETLMKETEKQNIKFIVCYMVAGEKQWPKDIF